MGRIVLQKDPAPLCLLHPWCQGCVSGLVQQCSHCHFLKLCLLPGTLTGFIYGIEHNGIVSWEVLSTPPHTKKKKSLAKIENEERVAICSRSREPRSHSKQCPPPIEETGDLILGALSILTYPWGPFLSMLSLRS